MPPWLTAIILGLWQIIGALSILLGIFAQIGAMMLIVVAIGAIIKKIFVWHTGFYQGGSGGWHYDLILLIANLVILTTGGRPLVII